MKLTQLVDARGKTSMSGGNDEETYFKPITMKWMVLEPIRMLL
jgi:hypothetical protein